MIASQYETSKGPVAKDTDDVVEEEAVGEAAILTYLLHDVTKQRLVVRPIILQQNDHVTECQVRALTERRLLQKHEHQSKVQNKNTKCRNFLLLAPSEAESVLFILSFLHSSTVIQKQIVLTNEKN